MTALRFRAAYRETSLHDAMVLDCGGCGGLFLPKHVVMELSRPDGKDLRLAFPRRQRVAETEVRYLVCPVCAGRMNRTQFVKSSGVIVDVCKEDGIWFDAGEVNAVIELVESGGLERAERLKAAEQAAEIAKLQAQWRAEREAGERATWSGRQHVHLTDGERALFGKLAGLFEW